MYVLTHDIHFEAYTFTSNRNAMSALCLRTAAAHEMTFSSLNFCIKSWTINMSWLEIFDTESTLIHTNINKFYRFLLL